MHVCVLAMKLFPRILELCIILYITTSHHGYHFNRGKPTLLGAAPPTLFGPTPSLCLGQPPTLLGPTPPLCLGQPPHPAWASPLTLLGPAPHPAWASPLTLLGPAPHPNKIPITDLVYVVCQTINQPINHY